MAIKIIDLGVHTVRFGDKGDPDRIRKMVGGVGHVLDEELSPGCFWSSETTLLEEPMGIDTWPEGNRDLRLIASYLGKSYPNFESILLALLLLGKNFPYHFAGFPHLTVFFSDKMIGYLRSLNISPFLICTDPNSLWRNWSGHRRPQDRYIPGLNLGRITPGYYADKYLFPVELTSAWDGRDWFLFCQDP